MASPSFRTPEVAKLYEAIRPWSHPEHPFLDAKYSPGSCVPAIDMTHFVADCIANGRLDAIQELWSYLVYHGTATDHLLKKALKAEVPDWLGLSQSAIYELKAINLLLLRMSFMSSTDVSGVGSGVAATLIGSRQLTLSSEAYDKLLALTKSETTKESTLGSTYGVAQGAKVALDEALSPLGEAEPCSDKLKSIPPMARMVVADYVNRGWGQGLRLCLYYGERLYGCGDQHNQVYIDWLDYFGHPDDTMEPPAAATKDLLRTLLEKNALPCKKTATRKEMIELARTVPGLVKSLFLQVDPGRRPLRSEWVPAVHAWAKRVEKVKAVGAGVLKTVATSSLYA
jgi:hypothetical protein